MRWSKLRYRYSHDAAAKREAVDLNKPAPSVNAKLLCPKEFLVGVWEMETGAEGKAVPQLARAKGEKTTEVHSLRFLPCGRHSCCGRGLQKLGVVRIFDINAAFALTEQPDPGPSMQLVPKEPDKSRSGWCADAIAELENEFLKARMQERWVNCRPSWTR